MKKGLKKVLVMVLAVVMLAGSVLTAMAAPVGDVTYFVKFRGENDEVLKDNVPVIVNGVMDGKTLATLDISEALATVDELKDYQYTGEEIKVLLFDDGSRHEKEVYLTKKAPVVDTVEVTFIDEATKAPVGDKVNVKVVDGMINTGKLTAPNGYEVCVKGDMNVTAGAGVNVEVRKVEAPVVDTVEVTFIDEATKAPVGDKVTVKVVDGMINTGKLTAPEGYEVCVKGDMNVTAGAGANVEVRKVAKDTTVEVTFIDEATKAQVGKKVNVEVVDGMINTGKLTAPEGYEVCEKGDVAATAGAGLNVEVRRVAKLVEVTFIDAETKAPVGDKVSVEIKDGMINTGKLTAPEGYEVCEKGDVFVKPGTGLNVEVRKVAAPVVDTVEVTFIDEETKAPVGDKVDVEVVDGMINTAKLTAPEGYEVCVLGDVAATAGAGLNVEVRRVAKDTTVEVTFIDEETKAPVGDKVNVEVVDGMINTAKLTAPEGYEVCVLGDVAAVAGAGLNVEVRRVAALVEVTFIDEETKAPVGEKVNVEIVDGMINTAKLTAPEGYEVCEKGDFIVLPGSGLNVEVRKVVAPVVNTVEVTFIDEETKAPVGDKVDVEVVDGMINTAKLTAPEGYEVCEKGDVFAVAGAGLNVEVRKLAATEKTVYVSYIDEETKMPFEGGIEAVTVAADATTFNTSVLAAVPEGYELCVVGDVYFGENDTVNVEVRKVAVATEKTIYVSYIDEETKMPFENGIEAVTVAADATYFNTSVLKAVPEGYELCVVGDVYFGENDTVNVEVRKVAQEPGAGTDTEDTNKPNTNKPAEQKTEKAESETVKTGDVSTFLPMVIVMVAAAAVVAVLSLRRKNRR